MAEQTNGGGPAGQKPARPDDIKGREFALLELAKSLRAMGIYPARHPQRASLLGQARANLQQRLAELGDLSFRVARNAFFHGERRIGEKHEAISELANELHLRQIRSFSLKPDLTAADLTAFLELALEAPEKFRKGRYVERWFSSRRIQTIWVNEMDFSKIVTVAESAAEEEDAADGPARTPEDDLALALERLEREPDPDQVAQLLREIDVLLGPFLEAKDYRVAWWAAAIIAEQAREDKRPGPAQERTRALALHQVRGLIKGEFLSHLFSRYLKEEGDFRRSLFEVLSLAPEPAVEAAFELVAGRESISSHRPLLALILEFGETARKKLESYFGSTNPARVWKAAYLVGQMRSRASIEALRGLLAHPEARARREAIRALGLIKGLEAARALEAALGWERDEELRLSIVTGLGELRDPAAVAGLANLYRSTPLREDTLALLEAVMDALGKIGSLEAVPHLVQVLNRRPFFNRELKNRLRIKAALNLGRLGGENALDALARQGKGGKKELPQLCQKLFDALLANQGKPLEKVEELLK